MSRFEKRAGRPEQEDDGHTIADMSMLDSRPAFPGRRPAKREEPAGPSAQPDRPWEEQGLTRKERLMVVLGALKATLLIAAVYIAGAALLIWLMVTLWP